MIPTIRMHLSLRCLDADPASARLVQTFDLFSTTVSAEIYCKFHRSEGCVYRKPFVAVQIGFELQAYDLELFEVCTNRLFDVLFHKKTAIVELSKLKSVATNFAVNINSKGVNDRPFFFLTSAQVQLLEMFGSSLSLDGYLMFSEQSVVPG